QRPRISHGLLREARRDGEATLRRLDRFLQEGLPVLVCEPSCASALTDDLPDLIGDEALGERVRAGVLMIDVFLADELAAGGGSVALTSPASRVLIHGHCHQKALYGTAAMRRLLGEVPGLGIEELDSGCCGMAGSFGHEAEHAALSKKIAFQRLLPAIEAAGPGAAVLACGFSCRHQLADLAGIEAKHLVQLLRAADH
ncbi:MAG: FAD-binding oxidoreductase, partial [Armatimonadetes bacterium]|nr:FAD-binding oxidoreductase [Armatimonadota bacterium]